MGGVKTAFLNGGLQGVNGDLQVCGEELVFLYA
jgi:hypothetical protein